jgi:hypothetical protein
MCLPLAEAAREIRNAQDLLLATAATPNVTPPANGHVNGVTPPATPPGHRYPGRHVGQLVM